MISIRHRWPAAVLAALLAAPAIARANELGDDLAARRERVMQRLGPDAMAILWSAPRRTYSLDVDYEYRQDSNLYYLTGLTQPETVLVLMPGNASRREILFVKERDSAREHWEGVRLAPDEAAERTGIRTVLGSGQFEAFVSAIFERREFDAKTLPGPETATFVDALAAGRARVALLRQAAGENERPTAASDFARRVRDRFSGVDVVNLTPILSDLRVVKTPYERRLLVKSLEISGEAHKAGMLAARPGAYEYEVKAAVETVYRGRGAVSWSYPAIVASGPNSTILHYPDAVRQMRAGDLLLIDAAGNYSYMSGDITRTYPVGGTFSPAQKDIYSVVLQAQEEAMKVARAGSTLRDIHNRTVDVIREGLLRLGLITDATGDQYRMWYTHGASHYIGIDVHDVGDRTRALAPGTAFTIEPGIYIRQSALDALARTPENLALAQRLRAAVAKYADIGVRVEDSFLLEETGLRRLSGNVPRTIDEIETFMRKRK